MRSSALPDDSALLNANIPVPSNVVELGIGSSSVLFRRGGFEIPSSVRKLIVFASDDDGDCLGPDVSLRIRREWRSFLGRIPEFIQDFEVRGFIPLETVTMPNVENIVWDMDDSSGPTIVVDISGRRTLSVRIEGCSLDTIKQVKLGRALQTLHIRNLTGLEHLVLPSSLENLYLDHLPALQSQTVTIPPKVKQLACHDVGWERMELPASLNALHLAIMKKLSFITFRSIPSVVHIYGAHHGTLVAAYDSTKRKRDGMNLCAGINASLHDNSINGYRKGCDVEKQFRHVQLCALCEKVNWVFIIFEFFLNVNSQNRKQFFSFPYIFCSIICNRTIMIIGRVIGR